MDNLSLSRVIFPFLPMDREPRALELGTGVICVLSLLSRTALSIRRSIMCFRNRHPSDTSLGRCSCQRFPNCNSSYCLKGQALLMCHPRGQYLMSSTIHFHPVFLVCFSLSCGDRDVDPCDTEAYRRWSVGAFVRVSTVRSQGGLSEAASGKAAHGVVQEA